MQPPLLLRFARDIYQWFLGDQPSPMAFQKPIESLLVHRVTAIRKGTSSTPFYSSALHSFVFMNRVNGSMTLRKRNFLSFARLSPWNRQFWKYLSQKFLLLIDSDYPLTSVCVMFSCATHFQNKNIIGVTELQKCRLHNRGDIDSLRETRECLIGNWKRFLNCFTIF